MRLSGGVFFNWLVEARRANFRERDTSQRSTIRVVFRYMGCGAREMLINQSSDRIRGARRYHSGFRA